MLSYTNTMLLSSTSNPIRFAKSHLSPHKSHLYPHISHKCLITAAATTEGEEEDSPNETQPLIKKSQGFGASSKESFKKPSAKKKTSKGKPSPFASSVTRLPLPSKPLVKPQVDPKVQQNETLVELTLLGFIVVVLLEGLTLAASGFLPDEWDDFVVKYIYPSYTPTVGLFVACAAVYGLYKYLGNQKKS